MAAKKSTSNKSGSKKTTRSKKSEPEKAEQLSLFDPSRKPLWLTAAFIFSLVLIAVVFISAGGIWEAIRNLVFGLFGYNAFIIPFINILLIIMSATGKSDKKFKYKFFEGLAFYTILTALIFIIKADVTLNFSEQISEAFYTYKNSAASAEGAVYGFGVYGAFFGSLPFLITDWNRAASIAVTAILLLIAFMLFTGTTILNIINSAKKPAAKVTEYTDDKIDDIKSGFETATEDVQSLKEKAAEARAKISERRRKKAMQRGNVPSKSQYDIPLESGNEKPDMGIEDILTLAKRSKYDTNPEYDKEKKTSANSISSDKQDNDSESRKAASRTRNEENPTDDVIALINKHTDGITVPSEKKAVEPEPEVKPFSQPQPFTPTLKKPRNQNPAPAPATPEPKKAQPEPQHEAPKAVPDTANTDAPSKEYQLPTLDCLFEPENNGSSYDIEELQQKADTIVKTLKSFGVGTRIVDICRSPSVTRFELQPDPGVKISRISNLSDDIAMNLAASGVRIEAPIPNKNAVGIEVPNSVKTTVTMREILDTTGYKGLVSKSKLAVALGRDIQGEVTCTDLAKMPHLLVAGTTGSGKSVCMNTMIVSILFNAKPDEVKLIMIDPKKVEFTLYASIPHLLVPVVTDPRKAAGALSWAASEMDKRYATFADTGVRNLQGYNKYAEDNNLPKLPQIVIFIDELAELMMVASKEVEDSICRLAQKARAAGMHLVIATQRPSVDVITGLIKANIPSRIALAVKSQVDSRTIIDTQGAEKLLGNGDMLFCPVGLSKPVRVQGAFLRDEEIENVIDFIKSQGEADYDSSVIREMEEKAVQDDKKKGAAIAVDDDDEDSDEMIPKAIEVVVECGAASTTLLQRKLKLGYARAARIVDELAERGIIGPYEGAKPRKVLMTKEQWYEMQARSASNAPKQLSLDDVSKEGYGYIFEDDEAPVTGGEEPNYFGQAKVNPNDGEDEEE